MNTATPARNTNRLLVVDADPEARAFIAQIGASLGFDVVPAASEAEFREEVVQFAPTVIAIDPKGIGDSGFGLFRWLGMQHGQAAVILTGGPESNGLSQTKELGLGYGLHVTVALRKPLTAEVFEAALRPQFVTHHDVSERDLRRAVDRAQLVTHYQPKIRAAARGWKITGVEALLRWDHPEYGLIYPDEFIGLAEQHGLIAGLTDYVLQTGIDQLSTWNMAGVKLDLSVNLSPRLFTDADFPDRMSEFLRSRGVAPDQLTLEVTETAALENPAIAFDIMSRLRLKGIGLSLDDFGTGYSSLTQLYKLPFSEVKIDRSIGIELPLTIATQAIVRAMIDLGHHLGLEVCCEGVENEAALEFLHRSGCDYAQGYCIARPMAAEDILQWITGEKPSRNAALRLAS